MSITTKNYKISYKAFKLRGHVRSAENDYVENIPMGTSVHISKLYVLENYKTTNRFHKGFVYYGTIETI